MTSIVCGAAVEAMLETSVDGMARRRCGGLVLDYSWRLICESGREAEDFLTGMSVACGTETAALWARWRQTWAAAQLRRGVRSQQLDGGGRCDS